MTIIAINENLLLVTVKQELIFLQHIDDQWSSVSHTIDAKLPLLPKKPHRFLPETEETQSEDVTSTEAFEIQNAAATDSLLAVSTTDKTLFLFQLAGSQLTFKSRRKLTRNTSVLRFFPDAKQLLVSDKTGDTFVYDCVAHEEPGRWILGHISQVLDVQMDLQQKLVFSCDRDEKVKITCYPETHEIAAFCLGHKEFVSSIQLIQSGGKDYLMSGSGDCHVKVWDFLNGVEVHDFEMESPVGQIRVWNNQIAILLRRPDKIVVYNLRDEFVIEKSFEFTDHTVVSMDLQNGQLFVLFVEEATPKVMHYHEGHESVLDVLKDKTYEFVDSLENLYKKRVDNISVYHEKKRRRIEGEKSKNKI